MAWELGVPTVEGVPAGHEDENFALPLGSMVTVVAPRQPEEGPPRLRLRAGRDDVTDRRSRSRRAWRRRWDAGGAPGRRGGPRRGLVHGASRRGAGGRARPLATPLFDVASLTKVWPPATLAALLVKEGADRARRAGRATGSRASAGGGKERVTVRQLLAHSSGLPWWRPWFERAMRRPGGGAGLPPAGRAAAGDLAATPSPAGGSSSQEALWEEPLEAPPGTRALYGDPAFLALGLLLEAAGGAPLDRLFADRVAGAAGARRHLLRRGTGRLAVGQGPCAGRRLRADRALPAPGRGEPRGGERRQRLGHGRRGRPRRALLDRGATWRGSGRSGSTRWRGRGRHPRRRASPREFARRDATPGSERALGWDTPSARAGRRIGSRLGARARLARSATWATRGARSGSTGTGSWSARCSRTTSTRAGGARREILAVAAGLSRRGGGGGGVSGMADAGRRGGGLAKREAGPPHRRGRDRAWAPSPGCSRRRATR